MFVKGLRKFLYAGALLALAPILATGNEPIAAPAAAGASPAPGAAPCMQTVQVCEMVAEPYTYTRTVYKPVTKQETYTTYKCETVTETKTRQVTEYQKVCETVNETRTITKRIPCIEERTEMVTKWKCEKVTEMVTKTVHGGHFECCTVPAGNGFLGHLCGKCPDPCATKTVRKWVSDCRTECVPVCRTKMVKECVPVCRKVCTYKCVTETCVVPVTRTKCVPVCKTVTYTECRKVSVPVQCTRNVTCCVPVCETCQGTRMVPRLVSKQVPVVACSSPCADNCGAASGCGRSLFAGLKGRVGCHTHKCSKGCGSACGVASACGGCK